MTSCPRVYTTSSKVRNETRALPFSCSLLPETDEPTPDYSDDDDTKEEDYVELRKTVKNRISAMLTREEWDQVLDRSGLQQLEGTERESARVLSESARVLSNTT